MPKARGGSCVFYLPHFQLLRPNGEQELDEEVNERLNFPVARDNVYSKLLMQILDGKY